MPYGWRPHGDVTTGQAPQYVATVVEVDTAVAVVTEVVTMTIGDARPVATAPHTVTADAPVYPLPASVVTSSAIPSVATTASAPAVYTSVSAPAPQQDPSKGPYDAANLKAASLNSTNFYRRLHSAPDVVWNDAAAAFAQSYTEKCLWQHSGSDYGENLAGNYDSPTSAIDGWASEDKMYSYSSPGFTEDTGHFTQLVWKKTTSIGCAVTKCPDSTVKGVATGWFFACEYDPPGNYADNYATNVTKAIDGSDGALSSRSITGGAGKLLSKASGLTALSFVLAAILAV